jgi:hypothetical protein
MDLTPHTPSNGPIKDEYLRTGPRALAATMSWGEQLLPLAYAAMQCCWIAALLIGLGRLHMFNDNGTIMPLWAPFLIILASTWSALTLPDQTASTHRRQNFSLSQLRSSTAIIALLQTVLILSIIWGTFYSNIALWNPSWLGIFIYDLIQINITAFASIAIILLAYGLSYQGIRIARYAMEPATVTRGLLIGGIVFTVVILIQPLSDLEQAPLLLLLLLFFCLALFTRALAYAIFVRQEHLIGLDGNKYTQDRLVMSTVGLVCLLLAIIALVVSFLINPELLAAIVQGLAPAGKLYDKLAGVFVSFIAFLLSFIPLEKKTITYPKIKLPNSPASKFKIPPSSPVPAGVQTFASLLLIIIIVAIVAIVILLIVRLLNRRGRARRIQRDQHESLWSWQLFWSQFKRLLMALLSRFRRHKTAQIVQEVIVEDEDAVAVNRDVRAIYRAFLRWAASRGFTRQRNETPYELKQRLNQPFALLLPEIQVVTEIYTTARYSQDQPTEAEIERMQQTWDSLQQKSYKLKTE